MRDIPPDLNGSGASPADPDQPTHAPPRPATNGSRAVTSPPGLRCQRVVPSGSVTWSTGSRLATTTTGLSARSLPADVPAIPPPTLLTTVAEGTVGRRPRRAARAARQRAVTDTSRCAPVVATVPGGRLAARATGPSSRC